MDIEKAKEYFKNCLDDEYNFKNATRNKDKKAIQTVLNELDNNDKIIIAMAEQLTTPVHGIDWVIDYFTKKVTKED